MYLQHESSNLFFINLQVKDNSIQVQHTSLAVIFKQITY